MGWMMSADACRDNIFFSKKVQAGGGDDATRPTARLYIPLYEPMRERDGLWMPWCMLVVDDNQQTREYDQPTSIAPCWWVLLKV